jgi:hypothetical protein
MEAKAYVFFPDVWDLPAIFVLQVLNKVVDLLNCDWRVVVPDLFVHGIVHRYVITEEGGLDSALLGPQRTTQVTVHSSEGSSKNDIRFGVKNVNYAFHHKKICVYYF